MHEESQFLPNRQHVPCVGSKLHLKTVSFFQTFNVTLRWVNTIPRADFSVRGKIALQNTALISMFVWAKTRIPMERAKSRDGRFGSAFFFANNSPEVESRRG